MKKLFFFLFVKAVSAQVTIDWTNVDKTGANLNQIPARNFSDLQNKPTTRAGYGITDAEAAITVGTTAQYWRGDKTWQALDKAAVGLSALTNDAQVTRAEMAAANGVATLDSGGKIPTAQIPAGIGAVASVAGRTGAVVLTSADVGLSALTNDAQVKRVEMGAASGVATLDGSGKILNAQIPAGVGLPSQAGRAGNKLTTDGTVASWTADRFSAQTIREGLVAEYWYDGNTRVVKNTLSPSGGSRNLCLSPEMAFNVAPWGKAAGITVTEGGFADPFGGFNASRVVASVSAANTTLSYSHARPPQGNMTFSGYLANYGATDVTVRLLRPDGSFSADISLPAKSGGRVVWVKFSTTYNNASGDNNVYWGVTENAAFDQFDVLIYGTQIERGSGASDYVPCNGHAPIPQYPWTGNGAVKGEGYLDFGTNTDMNYGMRVPTRPAQFEGFSLFMVSKWPSTRVPGAGGYPNDMHYFDALTGAGSITVGPYLNGNGVDKSLVAIFNGATISCRSGTIFLRDDKWHVVGFTHDGTIGRLWVDDLPVAYVSSAQTPVFVKQFTVLGQQASQSYGAPVQLAYTAVYNMGLSVAQWRQNFYAIKDLLYLKGITPQPVTKLLLVEGDSISTSYASITRSFAQSGLVDLGGTVTGRHLAVGGSKMSDATDRLPQVYETFTSDKTIILCLMMGVNDLGTRTPAQVWSDIQAYIASVKATVAGYPGTNLKVLLCCIPPTYTGAGNTARPENEQLNNLIRAASGTGVYDALCDFGALNLPYSGYIDSWHPSQTTHDTILKPAWLAALNTLL